MPVVFQAGISRKELGGGCQSGKDGMIQSEPELPSWDPGFETFATLWVSLDPGFWFRGVQRGQNQMCRSGS